MMTESKNEDQNIASMPLSIDGTLDTSAVVSSPTSTDVTVVKDEHSKFENLSFVPDNIEGGAKGADESSSNHPLKINEILTEGDKALNISTDKCRGSNWNGRLIQSARPHRSAFSSRLNPNHQGQLTTPSLLKDEGHSHAHTLSDDPSMHGVSRTSCNKYWLPKSNNSMYLGYHEESNERSKLLPDNSIRQRPSNLIEQYKFPLSHTSATSIVRPHSIVQTPLSNNAPDSQAYKPPQLVHSTIFANSKNSYLPVQNNSLQYSRATVNPNNYRPPATATNTIAPKPTSDFDRCRQQNLTKDRSMAGKTKNKVYTAKKRPRVSKQTQTASGADAAHSTSESLASTSEDREYVQTLVNAMHDMSSSEDNEGMVKSWDKIRNTRAARITQVCEELLLTTKKAVALNGRPLCGRKRSSNKYATFADRFNAICNTLRTQKTVCKHLMEDPYLDQVVDDPIFAATRVTNNRRVNKGKKVTIEQGRKFLGLKGNGKGRPLVKSEDEEGEEEGEEQGEEEGEEEGPEETISEDGIHVDDMDGSNVHPTQPEGLDTLGSLPTPTLRDRSTMKKPSYVSYDSDDVLEVGGNDPEYSLRSPKRQKRSKALEPVTHDSAALDFGVHTTNMENLKPEPEAYTTTYPLLGNALPMLSPLKAPQTYPANDSFSFGQGNNNGVLPYGHLSYNNGFSPYGVSPYQQFPESTYPTLQPGLQSQMQLPQHLDTTPFESNESYFDSSSNTEHYTSDPLTDETDAPFMFMDDSSWLHNHSNEPPQP